MTSPLPSLTRRQALASVSAGAALAGPSAADAAARGRRTLDEAGAAGLIDRVTDRLMRLSPESATSNNVDQGLENVYGQAEMTAGLNNWCRKQRQPAKRY